ncbi:MAG: hypothetical protein ACYTG0_17965 [Planctomycetota bacterium]|jgi:hypothetical protein
MIARTFLSVASCGFVLLMSAVAAAAAPETLPHRPVLDETPKVFVVNGYSTSFQWPRILQRKLDRYFGRRVIEVKSATKGGTPIAKWMDAQTGEPLKPWTDVLRPALKAADKRPRIVLAQQSLQWAFGERSEGIRTSDDRQRVEQGADVIQRYAELALKDGAQQVFIAMHIYKHPMEPEIGNERLAIAELLKRKTAGVHAGPDVWEPTKKLYPKAFARDLVHPNSIGAEVMAQKWFEALLEHDGLEVPEWSREEMQQAIDGEPQRPEAKRRSAPAGNRRPSVEEFFRRNDRNGDGTLTKEEFPEGVRRVFDRIDANGDGVVTKEEHTRFRSSRTRR